MRNVLLIIKHEIITTLGKSSFWMMTFLFPAIILMLSVGMQMFGTKAIEDAEASASSIEQSTRGIPVGYVDESNVLDTLPEWVPDGYLERFPNESVAKTALDSGAINNTISYLKIFMPVVGLFWLIGISSL